MKFWNKTYKGLPVTIAGKECFWFRIFGIQTKWWFIGCIKGIHTEKE